MGSSLTTNAVCTCRHTYVHTCTHPPSHTPSHTHTHTLTYRSCTVSDVEALDIGFYNSLKYILENNPEPLELTFTVLEESFGEVRAAVCLPDPTLSISYTMHTLLHTHPLPSTHIPHIPLHTHPHTPHTHTHTHPTYTHSHSTPDGGEGVNS